MQPPTDANRPRTRRILTALALLATLTGCTREPATTASAPAAATPAGRALTVAAADPAVRELLAARGRAWAVGRGVTLAVVADPNGADARVVRPWEMPGLAAAGSLAPVPASYQDINSPYGWSGLLPLFRDRLLLWDGTAYALPLAGEGRVCLFRPDFLTTEQKAAFAAKRGRAFTPARTWAELAGDAEAVRALTGKPPLPARGDADAAEALFYAVAAPLDRPARLASAQPKVPGAADDSAERFSAHFDLASGKARIAGPAYSEALSLVRRLDACRGPGDFRAGGAFFAHLTLTELAALPDADSPVRDRFDVVPTPGSERVFDYAAGKPGPAPAGVNRVPYSGAGGWLGVVTRDSPDAESAFALFAALSDPDTSGPRVLLTARFGAGPYRTAHLDSSHLDYWEGYHLRREVTARLQDALRQQNPAGLINPYVRLRVPGEAAFADALRPVLAGTGELAGVAAAWDALAAKRGPAFRAQVRAGLGLR